jgi:hypothetical protein
VRSLARQPTFACVAILTLVLGIGTNTAIFSVIKAVLLNQLPYPDPSRLVVVREQNPDGSMDLVAPLTYLDWKQQSTSVPAWPRSASCAMRSPATANRSTCRACAATANMFSVLRASPMLGRTFSAGEGEPGADRVAVLSRAFWQRHFGGSAAAIGGTIQLDAQPYTDHRRDAG